jgi:hypothetical protein
LRLRFKNKSEDEKLSQSYTEESQSFTEELFDFSLCSSVLLSALCVSSSVL